MYNMYVYVSYTIVFIDILHICKTLFMTTTLTIIIIIIIGDNNV